MKNFYEYTVSDILGLTMSSVERRGAGFMGMAEDEIIFSATDGTEYRMYHRQDCCEDVYIESVDGPLDVLVGSPITMAEEVSNAERSALPDRDDSYTWTFYKLGTAKGSVTIRWYGTSNGYYSEDADFERVR